MTSALVIMWMMAQAIMLAVIITVPLEPDTAGLLLFTVPSVGFLICAIIDDL